MKVYIDLQKLAISKVVDGTSPEYQGDINSNVFEILFFNFSGTNWFPTMSQLAPNGREAGDFEADALGQGETHDYTEDGISYKRYTFTMGDTWVLMKGRSNLYVWYNVLEGSTLKKCVGKLNVMLNESNDNYFISNPVFNPAVKTYIDSVASDIEDELNDKIDAQNATIASLSQASPSVFDTTVHIQALQENKGVAVATDTGYIWYWDTTVTPNAYSNSNIQYNSLANYVKHSGNQLQDSNGNNIYPNIDTVTANKTSFMYSINVFNKGDTSHDGKLVSNGNIVDYSSTGYFELTVKNGDVIHFKNINTGTLGKNLGSCFTTDGNTLLGNIDNDDRLTDFDYVMTADSLVRINFSLSTRDTFMVFVNGIVPSFYMPYGVNLVIGAPYLTEYETPNGAITKSKINDKFINEIDFLNNNNVLTCPMLNDSTKFDYNSNYGAPSIVDVDGEICKGLEFGVSSNGASLLLYCKLDDIVNGEYIAKCSKISQQKTGRVSIFVRSDTAYLGTLHTSNVLTGDFEYSYTIDKSSILSTYPTATTLSISFSNGSATYGCVFYKPYFGLKNKYNDFYNPLLNKSVNSVLYRKSIALDGDSICYGADYLGGYGKIISDTYYMEYINQAVSGATIATGTTQNGNNRHWISTNIDNMPKSNYVLIEGGVNDYYNDVPLGTFTPYFDLDKTTYNTTTFYGALDYLFTSLVDEFVSQGCKVAFLIQHQVNRIKFVVNGINLTYADYYNAIIQMCTKYGIPVIDLYKNSGFTTYFTSLKSYTYNNDGLHPTETGYRRYYANKIATALETL